MNLRCAWPGKTINGRYTLIAWIDMDAGLFLRAFEGAASVVLELGLVGVAFALDRLVLPGWSVLSPFRLPPEEIVSKFLKQALAKAAKAAKPTKTAQHAVSPAHPTLSEFLTVTEVDGVARQTATLSVFYSQGFLRCFLNDRETRQSLCVTAESFQALLDGLEATLGSDEPGWRPMDDQRSPKGKKGR